MTWNVYVRQISDQEIIKTIPIEHLPSEINHEKFMLGLLRNMNTDRYFVDAGEVEDAMQARKKEEA